MKARYLALVLFATPALASVTNTPSSTVTPGQFVLRTTDNVDVVFPAPKTNRFDTLVLCKQAAESLGKTLKYKCDQSTGVAVTMIPTSTCADESAPHIYLDLVDLQDGSGAKGYQLPDMEPPTLKTGSDSEFMPERDWLYVHGPKWPDGYPNCWVRGWEDPSLWRQNPKAEPGKVFMERIEPGMTAADVEMPDEEDPVCPQTNTDPRCPPWVPAPT